MGSNRKDVRPTRDRVVPLPAPDTYGLERIIAKEATEPPPLVTSTIEKHFSGAVTQLSLVKGLGSVLRMKGCASPLPPPPKKTGSEDTLSLFPTPGHLCVLPSSSFVTTAASAFFRIRYSQSTTLAACCVCSDEINRFLDSSLQEHVACLPPFNLGGLSGFPFAGATGFGAYASHVPAGGALVLVYGPHVGVSLAGDVGKVERTGLDAPGGACGAARAAFAAVGNMPAAKRAAGVPILPTDDDAETLLATDFQQHIVTHHVCACYTRAAAAEEPQAELVKQLAGRIRESLLRIVPDLACVRRPTDRARVGRGVVFRDRQPPLRATTPIASDARGGDNHPSVRRLRSHRTRAAAVVTGGSTRRGGGWDAAPTSFLPLVVGKGPPTRARNRIRRRCWESSA